MALERRSGTRRPIYPREALKWLAATLGSRGILISSFKERRPGAYRPGTSDYTHLKREV